MADGQHPMAPLSFFVWDEFIDPGRLYECPGCGVLLDETCVRWDEDAESYVCLCPDCGMETRLV